jgi:uncharacterized membrane protein
MLAFAVAALACWPACASDRGDESGSGTGAMDPFGNAGTAGDAGARAAAGSAGGVDAGAGTGVEVCDGVDNDGDGMTDDVDAQGDGVCDCLRIATIGQIGPWSDGGNVFRDWLDDRSSTAAVELGDQRLTDDALRPFQVIVVLYVGTSSLKHRGRTLDAQHAFSDEEIAAFERWVRGGGGMMTTIGYTEDEAAEVANVNRLLAPFGLGYSTTELGVHGYVTDWTHPHPLTDMIGNIYTENGVAAEGSSGTTLARDSGGRAVLTAGEPERGHVIVWGDEWITYDSQWQAIEDQQVERLWLNMLKWMSPQNVCQVTLPGPD